MYWESIADGYHSDPEHRFVLVSLISKTGSSYLLPGARMLVRDDGAHWGGISAGCLEDTISATALECLRSEKHRILEIDTRPYFGCFGKITILLEVLPNGESSKTLFERIRTCMEARSSFNVVTAHGDLSQICLTRISKEPTGPESLIETIHPTPRILIFGDWPDGQAVARIAGIIGLIGSRKRREEVSNHLAEDGDMKLINALDLLHCPAGLDLGGQGHEAIALSVIAEIQSTFHKRNAMPLRTKLQPVHADSC